MNRDHLPKAKFLQWNRTFFVWVALFLPGVAGLAQDLHYSQFYGAPLHLNPSLTGIFDGDVRLMGQYRNQWAQVPVGYTTYTGAVDVKIFDKNVSDGFAALGIGYNHDQAGFADLRLSNFNINGAYTKKLGKRVYGSLGGQLGLGLRKWEADQVTYDNQYDAQQGTFDPDNPTGETSSKQKLNYGDFGLGFNVRYQVKEAYEQIDTSTGQRTKLDFGMGLFHLNRPNQFFTSLGPIKLPMRLTPYILADLQISKRFDLIANVAAQFQSSYRQYLGGLGLRFYVNPKHNEEFSIQLGGTFRFDALTNDSAIYPAVEARYKKIRAGFSYDVNLSKFNNSVDGGVGGPELFIHYIFKSYKPVSFKPNCPLI